MPKRDIYIYIAFGPAQLGYLLTLLVLISKGMKNISPFSNKIGVDWKQRRLLEIQSQYSNDSDDDNSDSRSSPEPDGIIGIPDSKASERR